MFNRESLFGKGGARGGREQQQPGGYGQPPQPPPRGGAYDTPMAGYDQPQRSPYGPGGQSSPQMFTGAGGQQPSAVPRRPVQQRQAPPGAGMVRTLNPMKVQDPTLQTQYIYGNM